MRELELIAAIEAALRPDPGTFPNVVRSSGDDAAVVRAGGYAVTSTDMMVDGIHFRSEQLSPGEIGHRALAAALSDLAAMAAKAQEGYLALALPSGSELECALALVPAPRRLPARPAPAPAG